MTLLCVIPTAVCAENVYVENNSSAVFSGKENSGYIGVIRDGRIPDPDVVREQYLAYADSSGIAYIGYKFPETMSANTLIYSPGIADSTGGWFADGDVRIEALYGDVWTEIEAYSTPEYPVISSGDEITTAGEYVFNFKPVNADGIRIIGTAGGSDRFISCSELSVLCDVDLLGYDSLKEYLKSSTNSSEVWLEASAKPIAAVTDPDVSGGSHNLGDINDGYIPKVGDSFGKQYDTVSAAGKKDPDHTEYIGYIFDKEYEIDLLEFTEGGNFVDGGWFENGSLTVEIYSGYQWKEVAFQSDPEYPVSDNREDFLPDFETYTFMLDEPVKCGGVRISGIAGGSANFISCGELRVRMYVPAEEEDSSIESLSPSSDEIAENDSAENEDGVFNLVPVIVLISCAAVVIVIAAVIAAKRKK